MRNLLKKVSIFSAAIFVLLICLSFKPEMHDQVLSDFWNNNDFSISLKNFDLNVVDKFLTSLSHRSFNTKKSHQLKQLTPYLYDPIVIHYTMTQWGSPYLDANLKITVDADPKLFIYGDDNGDITIYPTSSTAFLEIACPIIDPWEGYGQYYLNFNEYDLNVEVYHWDHAWWLDETNTPDATTFYKSYTMTNGNEYYVYLLSAD